MSANNSLREVIPLARGKLLVFKSGKKAYHPTKDYRKFIARLGVPFEAHKSCNKLIDSIFYFLTTRALNLLNNPCPDCRTAEVKKMTVMIDKFELDEEIFPDNNQTISENIKNKEKWTTVKNNKKVVTLKPRNLKHRVQHRLRLVLR